MVNFGASSVALSTALSVSRAGGSDRDSRGSFSTDSAHGPSVLDRTMDFVDSFIHLHREPTGTHSSPEDRFAGSASTSAAAEDAEDQDAPATKGASPSLPQSDSPVARSIDGWIMS